MSSLSAVGLDFLRPENFGPGADNGFMEQLDPVAENCLSRTLMLNCGSP